MLQSQPAVEPIPKTSSPEAMQYPVAYIMSRFPKLTETFVLYEILAAEQAGTPIEVFPLRREPAKVMHREAEAIVQRAHFTGWISASIAVENLRQFLAKPVTYLRTLGTVVRANLGSWRYLVGGVLYFPKAVYMAGEMHRLQVRHIHAHFCSHPAAVAFVINRLAKIPFSFTAHGSDLHCDRHMLREKVAAAGAVIAISDYNRRVILDECGDRYAGKVHVIHCGVDTRQFVYRETPTLFEQGKAPMQILCIGTLHEVKGQRYLLKACQKLSERGLKYACHFVGDGVDRAALASLASELGIEQEVVFQGSLSRDQVQQRLTAADVLVAPSVPTSDGRREGIPVVLMEAMASGVPCIGSDLSGIPELLGGECGLLTPPRDAQAVADAIALLHDDADLRRELAVSGRERIEQDFDLNKNAALLQRHFSGS